MLVYSNDTEKYKRKFTDVRLELSEFADNAKHFIFLDNVELKSSNEVFTTFYLEELDSDEPFTRIIVF